MDKGIRPIWHFMQALVLITLNLSSLSKCKIIYIYISRNPVLSHGFRNSIWSLTYSYIHHEHMPYFNNLCRQLSIAINMFSNTYSITKASSINTSWLLIHILPHSRDGRSLKYKMCVLYMPFCVKYYCKHTNI